MSKYLIVGGVAGGATTAARLRRLDEKSEIIMFERGQYISYANCGLPYYIGDVINDRNRLFVQNPDSFNKRFNIDIRTNSEVTRINRDEKTVEIKNLSTSETYKEKYDKLILSPGAEPLKPPIPGINDKAIFTLRNVPDTDNIKNFIKENNPKKAVIVGGGYIGLEMAENLHLLGISVTIVEMLEQVMVQLDYEMAAFVQERLKAKKIELLLKEKVVGFERRDNSLNIKLESGKEILSDIVILSIGVRPETKLAKDAGLKIGNKGGIDVNEFLQTSDPDIYAVGDAIEFTNPILNKKVITYLAGPANKQARIAANNIVFGNKEKYSGAFATAIVKLFELTAAVTGLNERTLQAEKIPYIASIIFGSSNAGYYPKASSLTIKILFSPRDGKLFGAQIVGYSGVDKRIDVISSIIKNNGTIHDLTEFEQAYAPPYSSAKDPVNIAGFVAENILNGMCKVIHWHEISKLNPNEVFILDVRTKSEYQLGAIPENTNIPIDELRKRLNEIPRDKKIIVYCAVGLRGYLASRILIQNGFKDVYNLSGGYKIFEMATQK